MKAARFHAHHDIRIEDIPTPTPSDDHVLIDVAWAGICGTDLHEYLIGPYVINKKQKPHTLTGGHLPITMGHEMCGHVSHAPNGAVSANRMPLKVGDAVMIDPRLNCRSCTWCHSGESNVCKSWGFLGLHAGGGFSETVAVRQDMCYTLPAETPLDQAILIEPLAVGRHALSKSGVPIDGWRDVSVLVLGGGPVGLSVLVNLKAAGATNVYVSEPTAQRQIQTKPWAAAVLDPSKVNLPNECDKLTHGRGIEVVFDCAGITAGMMDGMSSLRPKGTYVLVASYETAFSPPLQLCMPKELSLQMSMAYDDQDFAEVVRDFVAGKFRGVEGMVTARIALENLVQEGFEQLITNKDRHVKIIATPRRELIPQQEGKRKSEE